MWLKPEIPSLNPLLRLLEPSSLTFIYHMLQFLNHPGAPLLVSLQEP